MISGVNSSCVVMTTRIPNLAFLSSKTLGFCPRRVYWPKTGRAANFPCQRIAPLDHSHYAELPLSLNPSPTQAGRGTSRLCLTPLPARLRGGKGPGDRGVHNVS